MTLAPLTGSFFIILREGFEAMLIAMLIFTYLKKFHAQGKEKYVWYGIISGIALSIVIAMGFKYIAGLTHEHEEWFEGVTMLTAAGVLAYLSIWCHGAKNHFQEDIQSKLKPLDKEITLGASLALSFAVFIAILREGFEIVLFYVALISSSVDSGFEILLGGGLGVAGLIGLFIIMRKSMDKVPTDTIFQCSKYLFIIGSIYFAYLGGSEVYELLTETH